MEANMKLKSNIKMRAIKELNSRHRMRANINLDSNIRLRAIGGVDPMFILRFGG